MYYYYSLVSGALLVPHDHPDVRLPQLVTEDPGASEGVGDLLQQGDRHHLLVLRLGSSDVLRGFAHPGRGAAFQQNIARRTNRQNNLGVQRETQWLSREDCLQVSEDQMSFFFIRDQQRYSLIHRHR